MKPTVSIIIPALNEEANIADAVNETIIAIGDRFADYELLLFNDASTDRTGEIMDKLAAVNPRIRVAHNARSNNLGGVYKQGIAAARFDYIFLIPGDNENPRSSMIPGLEAMGRADFVLCYPTNPQVRPLGRRIGSHGFVLLMNFLFGHRLQYYNGTFIARTSDLRSITITTNSFAYQSEAILKLLKTKKSYVEVGVQIEPKAGRESKALRLHNLIDVCKAICHLFIQVHFRTPKHPTTKP